MNLSKKWTYISHLGLKAEMEIDQQKKLILSNQTSVIFFFLFVLLNTSIHFLYVKQSLTAQLSPFGVIFVLIMNKYGYIRISAFLTCLIIPFITLFFATYSKIEISDNVPIFGYIFPRAMLISYISLPFILIGKKDKWMMYVALLVMLFYIFIFDSFHSYLGVGFFQVKLNLSNYYFTNLFLVFPVCVIMLAYFFLTSINIKYENKVTLLLQALEVQNGMVGQKNKNITDSIRYAKKIQTAFLPKKDLIEKNLPNSFVLYLPRDIVSGDFYWFHSVDDLQIIIAADCTGHGVPGAFLSILGTTLLNEIIIAKKEYRPNVILDELRQAVVNALNQAKTLKEQKDGMDISVCILNTNTLKMQYAGANNALYHIRDNNLIEYKADRQPVGVYIKETPFTLHEIQMRPSETFYLFSDGYASQFGGPKNEKFKSLHLKDLLLQISKKELYLQKQELENSLRDWQGTNQQVDDILLIGVKI